MSYLPIIRQLAEKPAELEQAYQEAVRGGEKTAFAEAIEAARAESSENLLLAAWHYRLAGVATAVKKRVVAWGWALPLGLLNGLLLWLLSDDRRFTVKVANPLTGTQYELLPVMFLLAAPISAAVLALFLTGAGQRRWGRALGVGLGLAAAAGYVLLLLRQILPQVFQQQYLTLMVLHLGLLAWAGAGIIALAGQRDAGNRFAFLVKSLEAGVVGADAPSLEVVLGAMPARNPAAAARANGMPIATAIADPRMR